MGRRTKAKAAVKDTVEDVVQHVQDLLSKVKLVDNFDWGSLEGCHYESTRTKWAKDTPSEGVIETIEHVDSNHVAVRDKEGVELFVIGKDSPWRWEYKNRVVSVSTERTAKLPQELGPMPYTERIKFRIYLRE